MKKPIDALKLIHSINHTSISRRCKINSNHSNLFETIIDKDITLNYENIGEYINGKSTSFHSVNSNLDCLVITGNTNATNNISTIDNPIDIDRISFINIKTKNIDNEDINDNKLIPLKYSLGKMPNGTTDIAIFNFEKLNVTIILNTHKELLPGGLNWQLKDLYCNDDYYVFFASKPNVKTSVDNKSIRCTHFDSVPFNDLIDKTMNNNCISVSDDTNENGIWIKLNKSTFDVSGNKNIANEFKKWILNKSVSYNPIYIEYELTDSINTNILIDDYVIKTFFTITNITVESNLKDTNVDFSIFYKATNIVEEV